MYIYIYIYLLRGAFAYSMPITSRVNVCDGCTFVHWVEGQEMDLCDTISGLQKVRDC